MILDGLVKSHNSDGNVKSLSSGGQNGFLRSRHTSFPEVAVPVITVADALFLEIVEKFDPAFHDDP